jgi:hypothetical protein
MGGRQPNPTRYSSARSPLALDDDHARVSSRSGVTPGFVREDINALAHEAITLTLAPAQLAANRIPRVPRRRNLRLPSTLTTPALRVDPP